MSFTKWQPATVEQVEAIVQRDLEECDAQQIDTFRKFAVRAYQAPIFRYGRLEHVIVVARRHNDVIYWEDVEEGFNFSPLDEAGRILEHWCDQNALGLALNSWIQGRGGAPKVGPAAPAK